MTMQLSTNLLIDLISKELNTTNAIIIAEAIDQYFDKDVSIDYVEFYLEKHGFIDREHGEFAHYSTNHT